MLAPALGIALVAYFVFHMINGGHGYIARNHLRAEVEQARATLEELREKREWLEHRADLLDPDQVDLDMLDEQVRAMLNYVHPDDVIVFLDEAEPASSR